MRTDSARVPPRMSGTVLTSELCAERFGTVLRRWTGEMRNASKRLARSICADPRVVENYIYGRHCPPAWLIRSDGGLPRSDRRGAAAGG